MASRPETWPTYPDELLPNILFKLAAQYPDLTYSEYPRSKDVADGYRKITFKEVANAAHAVAWWIERNVGKPAIDDGSETLVYMGPNDLRYTVLVLGSVMVGYKMLFPTPRYGAESIARLVACIDGHVMLVPSESSPVVSEVLAKRPMRRFDFPSVDHLIASTPAPYEWTKSFKSNKLEPLVCLHTSGTTGFPKPIIWTHDWANSVVRGDRLPSPAGYERPEMIMQGPRTRIMRLFPSMHASGIITALFFQLGCGSVIVHAPSRMMPNEAVDTAVDALEALGDEGKVDLFGLPPPHAEYLAVNKPLLERVGRVVETVLWAGGSISDAAGKTLSAKVQTITPLASTEMGLWSSVRKLSHDSAKVVEDEFQYNSFHPSLNIRFDEASKDDRGTLYEAVIVRNQGEGAWVQPVFKIFTDVQEKSLGDLFTQHPHDPEKWKHAGRSDDLLVFLDTMKFHPGFAEQRITAHPGVAEALIAGTRRPKASLIVRLNDGADIDEVQRLVEDVTKDFPFYARINRSMILTVTEPFPKTAKGSIQKKATLSAYEKQLDALYGSSGQGVDTK